MVRPGITGWAQVRYRYANDLEEEVEKMRYDLYYIKHMSPWLDLRILFETVRIVVRGRESAHDPAPARRTMRHSEALRLARATLRLAAATPLGVGLAPAPVVRSPAELVAAPLPEPVRVRPDVPGKLTVNGESS
jgi:hypothetical protein